MLNQAPALRVPPINFASATLFRSVIPQPATSGSAGFEVEIYSSTPNSKNDKDPGTSTAFPCSYSQVIPQARDCRLWSAGDIALDLSGSHVLINHHRTPHRPVDRKTRSSGLHSSR